MGRAACLSDGRWMGALMGEQDATRCHVCHGVPRWNHRDPCELCGSSPRCPVCRDTPRYQRGAPCEQCGSRPAVSRARYQGSRMGTLAFDEWSEVTKERDGEEADALAEHHESMRRGY
jgi:hypothetical protein